MQINIRKASIKDMHAVHGLVYDLAVYEKEPESVKTSPSIYEQDFKAGIFDCFVAEIDGEVVGITLYYMAYSSWKGKMLYLDDFVVKESHRRYGIGQLLFDNLLEEAARQKCSLVKWQVLDWNEPAVAFYEKNKAIIERNWWNVKIPLV